MEILYIKDLKNFLFLLNYLQDLIRSNTEGCEVSGVDTNFIELLSIELL
jgi:hypothetical protein